MIRRRSIYRWCTNTLNFAESQFVIACDVSWRHSFIPAHQWEGSQRSSRTISESISAVGLRQLQSQDVVVIFVRGQLRVRVESPVKTSSFSGRCGMERRYWVVPRLKPASCTASSKGSRFVSLSLPIPSRSVVRRLRLVQLRYHVHLRRALTAEISFVFLNTGSGVPLRKVIVDCSFDWTYRPLSVCLYPYHYFSILSTANSSSYVIFWIQRQVLVFHVTIICIFI